MSDSRERYLDLSLEDQADLLNGLAPQFGRRAEILEKDIWLCQILGVLFSLPNRKPMAFKGGTSLSKVYQAIERFSEDIDVTIDYRSLVEHVPDLAALSNKQSKKLSDALKASLAQHVTSELAPALQEELHRVLPAVEVNIEISENGEELRAFYPSAVGNADDYLRPNIFIEFGGRNAILPQDILRIRPDVAPNVPAVEFPSAQVTVLSPLRTFWEKATLVHVECHRPDPRVGAERLSRHWYDLARLADHEIGRNAIADFDLLRDVLNIKQVFFRSSYSNYDLCTSGDLKLIPQKKLLDALRKDYQAMLDAQMFYGETLSFDRIVERLSALTREINKRSVETGAA